MRKIDSLLSEQKKRLLRRINMSVQHQVGLYILLLWSLSYIPKLYDHYTKHTSGRVQLTHPLFFPRRFCICTLKWQQTLWSLELSEFIWMVKVTVVRPSIVSRRVFLSNRWGDEVSHWGTDVCPTHLAGAKDHNGLKKEIRTHMSLLLTRILYFWFNNCIQVHLKQLDIRLFICHYVSI